MNLSIRSSLWLITLGAFSSFFLFGFSDNLKGSTLSFIIDEFMLSYTQAGVMLMASYFGFLVATLAAGFVADMAGNRVVLLIASAAVALGLGLYSFAPSFAWLLPAILVVGLGLGFIEVGGNALIVQVHQKNRGMFLNLLGAFHGIGSMLAPIIAVAIASANSWRIAYRGTLLIALALFVLLYIIRIPPHRAADSSRVDWSTLRRVGLTRRMFGYYLFFVVYVGAELGLAAWVIEYLRSSRGFSIERSAIFVPLFFAGILAGRLGGSFIVERVGYLRVMKIAACASLVTLSVGIFGPERLVLLIPATGLFYSIMFPTATAAVIASAESGTGALLGILFAFGGIGGMLGPGLIGAVSDRAGLQIGFATLIVLTLIMTITLFALDRTPKRVAAAVMGRVE